MALSRELLKRLNSDDYPLPKRLKLAETAFYAEDLPLVRKEDLLLEWLCKICPTNEHSWKTLNNCLRSVYINITASMKQCLIDMLIQALNSNMENIYEDILKSCSLVLTNISMRQYFINKPKILGLLIKTLLNNISKHYSDLMQEDFNELSEPCKLSPLENDTVIDILESLMQIYKQMILTKDELRSIFIQDILYLVCSLVDHTNMDNTNRLGVAVYKCIQRLLLGKNRSVQTKETEESNQSMLSDLFCILSKHVETSSLRCNLLTYQFIFRSIIGTYKSDPILLDVFFRNLINSSGKYKWEILDSFLKLLNDIIFNFDNTVEGITLTEYFQNLINNILTHDNMISAHYGILIQLSYINPVLIENNISDILNKILIKEQTVYHTNLLIAILHASTKLRREQKFISQLLTSLKQQTTIKKTYKEDTTFFLDEFRIKLMKTISNFTSSQTITTIRTLVYYLNTDCAELLQSNTSCKNILLLKVTVELLTILFEGMQVFEYTRTLSAHEKFVNGLDEIGNALSLLINKALCLNHNKTVIIILLSAVQSLSEIQSMFKYYILKDPVTKKLPFPILDDPWQQLIQRITNFGEDNCKNIMNKLILYRLKIEISNKPIKLHGLIDGLEYSWSTILKHDTTMLSLLHDKEISKVTYLLLVDITSSEKNFHDWLHILDKEYLQENRRFIMYLLSHIFIQIGQSFSLPITEHISAKLLMENEYNNKLLEILQILKEQISQEHWLQMTNTISLKIELYLEIFLHLPTMYFSSNVKILIFLVVYSISRKYETNDKVSGLCNMIFSDLLEKAGIDVFQYIEPKILVNQLSQNKVFSKACEFSLRNVKTYATLKSFVKVCDQHKEIMCIILECMDAVRSKLDTEQKVIFRKAEKKLAKAILKILPEDINSDFDVRCLTAVLKVKFQTGKITDPLKQLTEVTLRNIFAITENSSKTNSKLLQQGILLSIIVLQHRKMFEIHTIIKNLWFVMLKHPYKNLIELLLVSNELKEFYELLKLLQDQTINSLIQKNETEWTNLFVVWSSIMKTDMNVKRNKMRLNVINNLFQTVLRLDVPTAYWSGLLHLSHDIISAKHLLIPDITIDLITLISLKSLDEANISSCEDVLAICRTLIKVKTDLIIDRLPNLLLLYRHTVNIIVHASKNITDKFDEHRFRCFALDVTKFTSMLVKLKKDMIRLGPYVIADLLQLIVEGTIPSYVKMAIHESLCQLISICDQHGLAFLSRTLPTSLQEVFKVQLNTFKKFYKYSGKI
ncbi:uncharacterized protein LOC105425615 isoform X1 [Pogonomyrmex barbatus]|uniref:Uncharacterized protein LOC105425615 isoform X1 n=2 Tax=Pogonomyrmex barbatus TaxID=144034 RepID=A0A6I9W171_9HYME|nr:uncharacterized protein LOC105425615 isoform X1 [Pogonomyrmex barbatus]